MSRAIARKGDMDQLGYVITGEVSDNVKINGQPVALKDSTMNDGVAITGELSTTIKVNGRPVALKDSTTDRHERNPKGPGIIMQGSNNTKSA